MTACKTIGHAISLASSGDSIMIRIDQRSFPRPDKEDAGGCDMGAPGLQARRRTNKEKPMATALRMPDYGTSSYQTAPLEDYSHEFQALARRLSQSVGEIVGSEQTKEYRGSYSIFAPSSSATVAKIIIYESDKGKTNGNWPDLQDGVYALMRANDGIGDRIWGELLPPRLPAELEHTMRERTIGVAPAHSERFAYVRVTDHNLDAIDGNSDCADTALKDVSEDTLNGLLKPERSMSMGKIGTILRLGRLIHAARPKAFDPKLGALLAFSPGPADIEQVVFLNYIAAELRNGKVHTAEYTSPHGMRLMRKLVLGLDEGRVGYGSIREWIKSSRFKKDAEVRKKLAATWVEFPGIVPSLWRALEATAAASAA
jgi:hypothetical protein